MNRPNPIRKTDLYPPNNSRAFLESLAEAELFSREKKFKSKMKEKNRATGKRKNLLDKY